MKDVPPPSTGLQVMGDQRVGEAGGAPPLRDQFRLRPGRIDERPIVRKHPGRDHASVQEFGHAPLATQRAAYEVKDTDGR